MSTSDRERKLLTFMYLMNIWFKRRQEREKFKKKKKKSVSTDANSKQVFCWANFLQLEQY